MTNVNIIYLAVSRDKLFPFTIALYLSLFQTYEGFKKLQIRRKVGTKYIEIPAKNLIKVEMLINMDKHRRGGAQTPSFTNILQFQKRQMYNAHKMV